MATAAFTKHTTRGSGTLRFRLMVEGWPYEWVTSSTITHDDNRDGRTVVIGLQQQGLQLHDRVVISEAALEADGMVFRIVPTKRVSGGGDNCTLMFSNYPTPVAQLEVSFDEDADELPSFAFVGGEDVTLENDTVYHLGTEAIRVGEYPEITRHIWDTQPQAHATSYFDKTRAVYVYEQPLTMDGRRCALYAYADGEDVDGDGQVIWRGIISRPPRLDSDGLTWLLDAEAITHVLKQKLAGGIASARPIGIYHHASCAFLFQFITEAGYATLQKYTGFDSEASLTLNVTAALQAELTAVGLTEIDSIKFEKTISNRWRVHIRTNAEVPKFTLLIGSPILGTVSSGLGLWTDALTSATRDGNNQLLEANRDYVCELVPGNLDAGHDPITGFSFAGLVDFTYDGTPIVNPLGNAGACMLVANFVDRTQFVTLPPERIWIDKDFTDAAAIYIPDSFKPGNTFAVTGTGNVDNYFYVEVERATGPDPGAGSGDEFAHAKLLNRGFSGFLTGATEISVIRDYGGIGSVCDFVQAIKDQSVDANLGDTPMVTDADLTTWAFGDDVSGLIALSRTYRFIRALELDKMLAEELKLAGHFPRIEADGRIGIAPLPNYTEAEIVPDTHTITPATIITPADGYGAWPGWEPQRDGLVTTVEIQHDYDPVADEWTDKPQVFQDANAIAARRGKRVMSIKPYSAIAGFKPEFVAARFVAEAYLAALAQDYSTVTLQVSFKHFAVQCGDIVSITHALIPAGNGRRGVVGRRAVCIERRWNLDAATGDMGTLTFMMSNEIARGYAPSAIVTAQSDQGSDVWNLTCSTANAVNQAISSRGDGRCLEHFHDGDGVRVVLRDSDVGTQVAGSISGEPNAAAGTCTVSLEGTWTPGSSGWVLEYRADPDGTKSTTSQRQFVYVADETLRTGPGDFAERFA